ncbi:MAG: YbaB/EbfC family nucleoid-associated protein [Planctomycetota bacterium]
MFDFKNIQALGKLVGRMDEIKERFAQVQEELKVKTVTGQAGGAAVRVVVSGVMEVKSVHLEPTLVASMDTSDGKTRELIEELIAEATNDALKKSQAMVRGVMADLAKEFDLPTPDQFGGESPGGLGGLGGLLGN